jgi:hypothetical protein
MIGHQHVSIKTAGIKHFSPSKARKVVMEILSLGKYRLAIVPPVDDMVWDKRDNWA